MNLNEFSETVEPLDMTRSDEFASLLASATDLSIPHSPDIPYRSRNVVLRHQRFHFLEWGAPDAPTIVLLHGGHQSAHSWDLVSLHLAQRYRVLALDQRGHGDSEWSRSWDYSNHTMALDAEAFIGAMGLQRPIVMAHSMGGRNSMLLAKHAPALLHGLVIVDVGPEVSEKGRKVISSFVRANEEFDDLEHFVRNVRKYDPYRSREHIERTVKYNMIQRADGKFVSKCDSHPRRAGVLKEKAQLENISLQDAGKFDFPVLIVRGENSNILEPDAAERFRDALPHGQLVTVPECGHNVHSQNTHGFIDVVVPFLDSLDR
jgi:pimeloyl-ACP methyl ester carboxylesterase